MHFTRPLEHNRTSEWDFIYNKAHNEYINYFATTGYVGLIGYVSIIFAVFVIFYFDFKKNPNGQSTITHKPNFYLFLSYISILITNFSGFSVSVIQIFFYLIPAIFLIELGFNKKEEHEELNISTLPILRLISIACVFIVGFSGMYYLIRYYKADISYAQAKSYISISEYGKALGALDDALKLKNEHVYEDKLSNVLAYLAFQYSFQDKKQASDLITLSKISNYKALSMSPKNMLYWKTRARNYYLYYQVTNNIHDLEAAVGAMEKAAQIAPSDVQTRYALAVLYVALAADVKEVKYSASIRTKAKDTLNTIFTMKPDYREAQELNGTF